MTKDELQRALIAAHEDGDRAVLSALYTRAADAAETPEEAAFFLTHAYVFALDAGSKAAPELRARLVRAGAER
ncbi:MAG: hypothetical protein AAGA70_08895 [Pseudomonadota bacterium]